MIVQFLPWITAVFRFVIVGLTVGSGLAFAQAEVLVTSLADSGPGSLREALKEANSDGGPTTLRFAVGGTIRLLTPLPPLSEGDTTIDGCVAPPPGVRILWPFRSGKANGILIESSGNTVSCLTIENFTVDGISIRKGANNNLISKNTVIASGDDGIGVALGSAGNVVTENVSVGNTNKGILVFDHSDAVITENLLVGNKEGITISTNSTATISHNIVDKNNDNGIAVTRGSEATISDNTLARNKSTAIRLPGGPDLPASKATIQRNTVLANGGHGIELLGGSSATIVDNEIIDNSRAGLHGSDQSTALVSSNRITGNAIGVLLEVGANFDVGGGPLGSSGGNTLQKNRGVDLKNLTPLLIYATKNIWDHTTEAQVDDKDVYDDDENASSGPVVISPLGSSP